jgi:heme exporter protein D
MAALALTQMAPSLSRVGIVMIIAVAVVVIIIVIAIAVSVAKKSSYINPVVAERMMNDRARDKLPPMEPWVNTNVW